MVDVLNLEQAIDGATEAVGRLAQEAKVLYGEAVRKGEELTEADLPERLRRRLMPEGYEWPHFEGGKPVRIGDTVSSHGLNISVGAVEFSNASYCSAEWVCTVKDGPEDDYDNVLCGTSFRRPVPPATPSQGCRDTVAPDSWEMLARDADTLIPVVYCSKRHLHKTSSGPVVDMANDIVRRAKALAGEVE